MHSRTTRARQLPPWLNHKQQVRRFDFLSYLWYYLVRKTKCVLAVIDETASAAETGQSFLFRSRCFAFHNSSMKECFT